MPFKIQTIEDNFIDSVYSKAMEELRTFFGLNWERNKPQVFVVEDRKTIDALKDAKSEPWVVGWADNKGIYLLSKDKFETDSSHKYSDEYYIQLIKHELSHMFYRAVTGTDKPRWLTEGISLHLAGQVRPDTKLTEFKNFLDYYDKTDANTYKESGYFVKLLAGKFGDKAILKFLRDLKGSSDPESVSRLFKENFSMDLSYTSANSLI